MPLFSCTNMGNSGGELTVGSCARKSRVARASAKITVRRSKNSKILPARRDQFNRKINVFPAEHMPGYDPTLKKILPPPSEIMPASYVEFMPQFFEAYWQFLHAVSFIPAQEKDVTEEMLKGVLTFFANLGLPEYYFPDCNTNACAKHYRAEVEALGGTEGLEKLVMNKEDRFALARWFNDFHNSVHKRRREDTVHNGIVRREDVDFERTKEYYMMNCGAPFYNSMVEAWLYNQFNLNVRKDMCRINTTNPKFLKELYTSFGNKIYLLYKRIYPYGEYNIFWRRPTHITDGYMCSASPFPFIVFKGIAVYTTVHLAVMRLLTTHSYVLDDKVTDETLTVFMAMVLTIMILGQVCVPAY